MADQTKKTYQEFAKAIKEKYPAYADIDDYELTQKIIEKYPIYADQVDLKKKDDTSDSSLDPDSTAGTTTEEVPASTGNAGETESKISNDKKLAANNFAKLTDQPLPYPEVDADRPAWAPTKDQISSEEPVDAQETAEGIIKRREEDLAQKELIKDIADEADDFWVGADAFIDSSLGMIKQQLVASPIGAAAGLSQMKYGPNQFSRYLFDVASEVQESGARDVKKAKASVFLNLSPEAVESGDEVGFKDALERAEMDLFELAKESPEDALKSVGLMSVSAIPYVLGLGAARAVGGTTAMIGAATTVGYGGSVIEEYARDKDVDGVDHLQSLGAGVVEGVGSVLFSRTEKSAGNLIKSMLKKGYSKPEVKNLIMSPIKAGLKGAGGEFIEEGLQGAITYAIGALDGDYEFDWNTMWKVFGEGAIVGGISGGFMNAGTSYAASRSLMNSEPQLHKAIVALNEEIESQGPNSSVTKVAIKKKAELQKRQRDLFIKKAGFISRLPEETQIKAGELAISIAELEIAEIEALKQETKDQIRSDIETKQEEFNKLVNAREENKGSDKAAEGSELDGKPESKPKADDQSAGTRTDSSDRPGTVDGDNTNIQRTGRASKDSGKGPKVDSQEAGGRKRDVQDDVAQDTGAGETSVPAERRAIIPERRKAVIDAATASKTASIADGRKKTGNKELDRLASSLRKQNDGQGVPIVTVSSNEEFEAILTQELSKEELSKAKNEAGEIDVEGVFLDKSGTILINTSNMEDNTAIHEAIHPILNQYLLEDSKQLDQLLNDAIANDETGVFNPVVKREDDPVLDDGTVLSSQKYSPLESFMSEYQGRTTQKVEGVTEGLARALQTSITSDNKTWKQQAMLFIDRMLAKLGIDKDIVIKKTDDYVQVISKLQRAFESGRSVRAENKVDRVEKNLSKTVSKVKKATKETGATFNLDGTEYNDGGLVIPIVSKNLPQSQLSPKEITQFIEENRGKLGSDAVKVGIYKFPDRPEVSIDLNVVAPRDMREDALAFAKEAGQESLFDLDTFDNVKSGSDGKNPKSFTDEEFKEIAKRFTGKDTDGIQPMESGVSFKKKGERSAAQVAIEDTNFAEHLTEEGDNYVFFHRSEADNIKKVDPSKMGSNANLTGKDEIAKRGGIGGTFFYTKPTEAEPGTGPNKYEVRVPKDKVYPFNSDPDNFYSEALKRWNEKFPGRGFDPNAQVAMITQIAMENGYDMVIARWRLPNDYKKNYQGSLAVRAETQKPLEVTKPITKTGQQNAEFFTGKAKEASSKIPYKPVLDVDQNTPVAKSYKKFTDGGNFTGHISKMIAGFAEKQMKVAQAVVDLNVDSFLDIGTSEGGLPKTIAANAPDMRVVGIDPNPTMKKNFDKIPGGDNVEYRMEALGGSWTETDPETGKDVEIKQFTPKEKFDVVNEDYTFQFISNDRKGQVAEVKKLMNPGGVFVTSEKFFTKNFDQNEAKKADHQSKYFSEADRAKDQEEIIVGMSDDMVKDTDYMDVLRDNFQYVHEFWNSGNFKGFIASDDLAKLQSMIGSMGDLTSEFSDAGTETQGNVPANQIVKSPAEAEDGDVLASGTVSFKKKRKFVKGTEVKNEKLGNLPVKDINDVLKSTDGRFILINSDPTGVDGVRLFGGVGFQAFEKNIKDNVGFAASSIGRVSNFQKAVGLMAPNGEPVAVFVMIQKEDSLFGNAQASELFFNKLHELMKTPGNTVNIKNALLERTELKGTQDFFVTKDKDGKIVDDAPLRKLQSTIKAIKKGDQSTIDDLFNLLGEVSFVSRAALLSGFFPHRGKRKSGGAGVWIKNELRDRGVYAQDLFEALGEKDFLGKDWGFIASGFITDNSVNMTSEEFQSKGIDHPLFNAKFYGKDPFILSAHYNVNEAFEGFEFEGSKDGVRGNVSQSFYVSGQKAKVDAKPVGKPDSVLEFTGRAQASFKKAGKKAKKSGVYNGKSDDISKRIRENYENSQAFYSNEQIRKAEQAAKKADKKGVEIDKPNLWTWMLREFRENFQDQQVRLKMFQRELVRKHGKQMTDAADAYVKLELMKTKALMAVRDLNWRIASKDNPDSLFRRVFNAGLDVETLGKYMAAIHAPERNRRIREINEELFKAQEAKVARTEAALENVTDEKKEKALQKQLIRDKEQLARIARKATKDHGGMTNEEAEEFLSTLTDEQLDQYAEFAQEYRENVTQRILTTKRDAGLITEEAFADMNAFDFYVPMKVDEFSTADRVAGEMTKGISRKTYAIKGTDKYGFNQRTNPVFAGLNELTAAIVEAEKNEAFGALHEMATLFPSDMLSIHNAVVKKRKVKGVRRFVDETDNGIKERSVKVFVNGTAKYVEVHDPKMRKMLKDPKQALSFLPRLKLLSGFARWFRITNTIANPEFLVSNIIRDVQNAMISANLEIDRGEGKTGTKVGDAALSTLLTSGGIFKRVALAGAAVRRARANGDYSGEYGQAFKELEEMGGITVWMQPKELKSEVAAMKEAMDAKGEIKSSKIKNMGRHIEAVSDSVELSTRLATYMVAKKAGLSKQQAASLAKNVTVNFDKKGTYGSAMNVLYLFSNAGIQGSFRVMSSVVRSGKVRALAATLIAMGAAEAELFELAGEEELYDTIPEWIKERNLIIPTSLVDKGYITINLPYGFNVFKYMGNNMRAYRDYKKKGYGGKTGKEVMKDTFGSVMGAFNPFYSATGLQAAAPTILDPVAQHIEMKTFFGTDLAPKNYSGGSRVESEAFFENTPQIWVDIAQALNNFTNFDQENKLKGELDWSPEVYENYWNTYSGGLARFFGRSYNLAGNLGLYDAVGIEGFEQKPIRMNDIPIMRKIISELPEGARMNYRQVDKILDRSSTERISVDEQDYFYDLLDEARDSGVSTKYINSMRNEYRRNQLKVRRELN